MHVHEIDVTVGDVLCLAGKIVTIIDIDQDEVTFRIDDVQPIPEEHFDGFVDFSPASFPR